MIAVLDKLTKSDQYLSTALSEEGLSGKVESLPINELIALAIRYNGHDNIGLESKQELVKRGKDNIQERIQIKKLLKETISKIDDLLKDKSNNKDDESTFKSELLIAVSIVDKLQLEWQKHDLRLNK